jgi:hypothetical protein
MGVNLKYYVITIFSIFLAIGIGIFVGIMLDGQDMIVEQQQQLVSQIESKFDEFQAKQNDLQKKIDLLTLEKQNNMKLIDMMYPEFVKDQLKDLNVVIIETSKAYAYPELADAFQKTGVNSVINIQFLDIEKQNNETFIFDIAKELNLSGSTKEEIEIDLTKKLGNALVYGNNLEFIRYLKDKKIIDYTAEPVYPIHYIVVAGGSVEKAQTEITKIDIPLINTIKSSNIPVMAVEKSDVAYSNISDYKKLKVSTVDNVDTIIGKISMLMVASGKEGHFGEKETAEHLMPENFMNVK